MTFITFKISEDEVRREDCIAAVCPHPVKRERVKSSVQLLPIRKRKLHHHSVKWFDFIPLRVIYGISCHG